MVLHFVLSKRMDDLLFHFISTKDINAAVDLVRLFHAVEGEPLSKDADEFKMIEVFVSNEKA